MDLKIEQLSLKFVGQVAKLESDLIAKTSETAVASTLKNDSVFYFVLLDGEVVVGFLECSIIAPESELFEIGISKQYQGKGLSKLLLDYYIDFAKAKSCDTIFLEVNKINLTAINLYNQYGFEIYGERKNYYGSNDAILMKRKI